MECSVIRVGQHVELLNTEYICASFLFVLVGTSQPQVGEIYLDIDDVGPLHKFVDSDQ